MFCFRHVNTIFQSIFHKFLYRFTQNLFTWKSMLFSFICSLLVGIVRIDCVTDKSKVAWKLHFLEWKTHSLVLKLVPRMLKSHFRGLKFQNFLGKHTPRPPSPPLEKGNHDLLLIQLLTLFKSAGYFYFYWNPWTCKENLHYWTANTFYGYNNKQWIMNTINFNANVRTLKILSADL